MRLFVAIQLSEEVRKSLLAAMHEMKLAGIKGNYTPGANLHLTVAFIGEVKDAGAVKQALSRVKYTPFKLSLDGTGSFGDILWAGVKGNQAMKALARDVGSALSAAGIEYDKKEFKPHITLVRKAQGQMPKGFAPAKAEMMVRRVSLMKSEVKGGKTVYTEIAGI